MRTRRPIHHLGPRRRHAQWQPRGHALGDGHHVGLDAEMLDAKHLAGAAHARLHFVRDQQDAVLLRQRAQPLVELRRRHDIAALALDRLDHHARNFIR